MKMGGVFASTVFCTAIVVVLQTTTTRAAPAGDLVTSIPGFEDVFANLTFKTYSGYLAVDLSDANLPYDALSIHYEFHTCVKGETECPVAVWHQGGPGGSAVFGSWTEMGPFQYMSQGPVTNFDNAWNNAANMLYLESPAGSLIADAGTGWSSCSIGGAKQEKCEWDDVTQAVAYARTLKAFYGKFPEFLANDLYLVGESYAGQYIPNIAYYLVQNPTVLGKNVSGIAVGNGCWGGDATSVRCNGPTAEQNDIEIFYGKGLLPKKLYDEIQSTCNWTIETVEDDDDGSTVVFGEACDSLLDDADAAVGPYNIYDIYDNCDLEPAMSAANRRELRRAMPTHPLPKKGNKVASFLARPSILGGQNQLPKAASNNKPMPQEADTSYSSGFPWNCESDPALDAYFGRADVQAALHLQTGSGSFFGYTQSGPASVTLYPTLLKYMRVLIYNGDADLCVPYVGNEQWTTSMVDQGYAEEKADWRPWFLGASDSSHYAPAGYVTTYSVPDKEYTSTVGGEDFSFLTIRLAGHMVPQYQPQAGLAFFSRFLAGDAY